MTAVKEVSNASKRIYRKGTGAGTAADPFVQSVVLDSALPTGSAAKDDGPNQTLTRTYTPSADMTTAAAITPAPASGQKIVAVDILISTDTAMNFAVQMETSNNIVQEVLFGR